MCNLFQKRKYSHIDGNDVNPNHFDNINYENNGNYNNNDDKNNSSNINPINGNSIKFYLSSSLPRYFLFGGEGMGKTLLLKRLVLESASIALSSFLKHNSNNSNDNNNINNINNTNCDDDNINNMNTYDNDKFIEIDKEFNSFDNNKISYLYSSLITPIYISLNHSSCFFLSSNIISVDDFIACFFDIFFNTPICVFVFLIYFF
jgi:hypothetical protein